jgi:hypothetical protein
MRVGDRERVRVTHVVGDRDPFAEGFAILLASLLERGT